MTDDEHDEWKKNNVSLLFCCSRSSAPYCKSRTNSDSNFREETSKMNVSYLWLNTVLTSVNFHSCEILTSQLWYEDGFFVRSRYNLASNLVEGCLHVNAVVARARSTMLLLSRTKLFELTS